MIRSDSTYIFYKALYLLRSESSKTYLSFLWWMIEPAAQVLLFFLIFEGLMERGGPGYVHYLVAGVVAWAWIAKTMQHSAGSLFEARSVMMQVYLPKYVFPSTVFVRDLLKQLVVFGVVIAFFLVHPAPGGNGINALLWIKALAIQSLFLYGVCLTFASLTPFVPDLRNMIPMVLQAGMFASGVFLHHEMVPERFLNAFFYNPAATILALWREALVGPQPITPWHELSAVLVGLVLVVFGLWMLRRFDRHYPRIVIA